MSERLIAIDARWLGPSCRGMGRHALHLIAPIISQVLGLAPSTCPKPAFTTLNSGPSLYPLWEQLWLPFLCWKQNVSLLVCPYNTAPLHLPPHTQLILVVHDLIFMSPWREIPPSSRLGQELGRLYRKLILPRVIHNAHKVVTVSEYSKRLIIETFGLDPAIVTVIPNSIGDEWFEDQPLPYKQRKSYILVVSGEAPSKNLPNLIKAFSLLREHPDLSVSFPTLRVVGVKQESHARFKALARSLAVHNFIVFEPFVDQALLINMYRNSMLFVMPSLSEGFGIPLIEAMALGTPIVCSNTASLPEVAGNCCHFFDPYNVDSMVQALLKAILNPSECEKNIACGTARSLRFSSDKALEASTAFWNSFI